MARILITSALPYINGIKHLGNLIGSQLPSDLYARYHRAISNEVMFICATDEHGTPAELAAAKVNMDVADYCRELHKKQSELAHRFRLSFDHYGRSSSPQNHALTQYFAGKLAENGLIEEVTEKQIYSNADKRYLPDRYIEGECPNCGSTDARGDQCENCTKQLDPTDLKNPRSAISGSTDLEIRETTHLYLKQSKMRRQLDEWITKRSNWPILTTSIAKKWLHDGNGLQDRSITRDLHWGIPVKKGTQPWEGMNGKVFYVWFDAPIEYIAATAEWAALKNKPDTEWKRWWRTDCGAHDVYYVQFMGKDNVPFHTLSFPCTIIGANDHWKLVNYIKSFNYLNYDGGQFSTSKQRGVFMDQALDFLPSDYWRWWLLSHAPETSDSEFTWDSFQQGINKDLADVLGNFVSRITKFCRSKFGEEVPKGNAYGPAEQNVITQLNTRIIAYQNHLEAIEIRKSAAELRAIWTIGNEYLQSNAPWSLYKENPTAAATIVRFALNLIPLYAALSEPFIPDAAATMNKAMNVKGEWPHTIDKALNRLSPGHRFSVPDVIFTKITDQACEAMKAHFAGHSE